MTKKNMTNKERIQARELLRLAECLDNIDDDVADTILKLQKVNKNNFSMSDMMNACQEIKNKAKKEVFDDIEEIMGSILGGFGDTPTYIKYKEVKDKHLTNNSNITNKESEKQ